MNRPARVLVWVLLITALAALVALLTVGMSFLTARAARQEILALPDFGRQTEAIREQLRAADAHARENPRDGDALGALGMAYHANAFHEHALVAYQLASRHAPRDFRWPYYQSLIHVTLGLNEQALAFLTNARDLKPDYPHSWARLGELLFRAGDHEQAAAAFRRAMELSPLHPHATLGLARLAGLEDRWQDAAQMLEAALAADASFGPAHDFLAIVYQNLGREEDFRRHAGRGIDAGFQMNDPLVHALYDQSSTGAILVAQAQIAENRGDRTRAEALLRRALATDPQDKDVYLATGRFLASPAFTDRAKLEEAVEVFKAGLQLAPDYVNMRHEYAQALYSLRRIAEAEYQWKQVLEREPRHAMALMSLGQVHFMRQEFQQARELYQRGLDIPPDTPFSLGQPALGYHRFAMVNWALGDFDAASTAFAQAAAHDPRMLDVFVDHARLLQEQGRPDDAVAVYQRGLAENPTAAVLHLGLGNVLLQAEKFGEAHAALTSALTLAPNDVRALSAMGFVELQMGNPEPAIERFRRAIQLEPRYALAHYHLGNALLQLGDRNGAIQEFEETLRLRPGFPDAVEALRRAQGQ